jgi:hypothetical protein
MAMKKGIIAMLLWVSLIAQGGWAQEQVLQDLNMPATALGRGAASMAVPGADIAEWLLGQATANQTRSDPNLCAIVVLPGPADSFDIRFGVFNVVADRLDFLIMDSFRTLERRSLLHQSVFAAVAPPSGTVTVHYPSGASGKGPVVLGFTGFMPFESAAFNTDPDTYDDPAFGATVLDMDQSFIELVYSSNVLDSLRCRGRLRFNAELNASIANIVQVFP